MLGDWLQKALQNNEIILRVIGWALTACLTLGTIMYKGVWKRITQLDEELSDTRDKLHKLIGSHNTKHKDNL